MEYVLLHILMGKVNYLTLGGERKYRRSLYAFFHTYILNRCKNDFL